MKYKLTGEVLYYYGVKLYRIQALKDFGHVKAGTFGGYVEKESNLSQEGNCWVYDKAKVYGDAQVLGNAIVSENAIVYENAVIFENAVVSGNARVYNRGSVYGRAGVYGNALVCNTARVFNNARVYGNAHVYGDARVYGNANIYGFSRIYENARVFGDTRVFGHTYISENAYIKSSTDYCCFQGFGSRNRITTFYINDIRKISVVCGCFSGTLKEFKVKVRKTHGYNKFAKQYMKIIEVVKVKFEEPNNKSQSVLNHIKRKVEFFNKMFKFKK